MGGQRHLRALVIGFLAGGPAEDARRIGGDIALAFKVDRELGGGAEGSEQQEANEREKLLGEHARTRSSRILSGLGRAAKSREGRRGRAARVRHRGCRFLRWGHLLMPLLRRRECFSGLRPQGGCSSAPNL